MRKYNPSAPILTKLRQSRQPITKHNYAHASPILSKTHQKKLEHNTIAAIKRKTNDNMLQAENLMIRNIDAYPQMAQTEVDTWWNNYKTIYLKTYLENEYETIQRRVNSTFSDAIQQAQQSTRTQIKTIVDDIGHHPTRS